jgi:DNA-binding CsgD family transcriptional regulator
MTFTPILSPSFSLLGLLAIQTVIAFSLAKGARSCSHPYIGGLATMEFSLLCLFMASLEKRFSLVMFFDMAFLVSRIALGPWWLWMSLEVSGFRKRDSRRLLALISLPVLVFSLLIFTNPLHHLYWTRTWFEGKSLAVEYGLLRAIDTGYCHFLLTVGSVFFGIGIKRHFGNERRRLLLLGVAFSLAWLGDNLYRLGFSLPFGANPLSFLMTLSFFLVGVSALFYGFPRMRAPITEDEIEIEAAELNKTEREAALDGIPGISDRQRGIVDMVAQGLTYRLIAERLGISERTVKYHMGQILDKCGLETREQLIALVAARRASLPRPAQ